MTKRTVYQLANGKWTHIKTRCEFDDQVGAETDYRFCCEWEG